MSPWPSAIVGSITMMLIVLAQLLAAWLWCGPLLPVSSTVVKLAFVDPLSPGPLQEITHAGGIGFRMAIEDANMDPTLNASNITVVAHIIDITYTVAEQVHRIFNLLDEADESLFGVVGPSTSSYAIRSAELLSYSNMPQATWSAGSTLLSNKDMFSSHCRTLPTARSLMIDTLGMIHNYFHWRTHVAMLYAAASEYGLSSAAIALEHAKTFNMRLSPRIGYTAALINNNTVGAQMASIKRHGARIVILVCLPGELVPIARVASEYGLSGPDMVWIVQYGFSETELRSSEDSEMLLQGWMGPSVPLNTQHEEYRHFRNRFIQRARDPAFPSIEPQAGLMQYFSMLSYEATWALIEAFKLSQPTSNRTEMVNALSQVDFIGPTGYRVRFDSSLDLREPPHFGINQVVDGKLVYVAHFYHNGTMANKYHSFAFNGEASRGQPLPDDNTAEQCQVWERAEKHMVRKDGNLIVESVSCVPCPKHTFNPGEPYTVCVSCKPGDEEAIENCFIESTLTGISLSEEEVIFVSLGTIVVLFVSFMTLRVRERLHRAQLKAEMAEDRAAAETDFVAYVFHEARNPMVGVHGNMYFARETVRNLDNEGMSVTAKESLQNDLDSALDCCNHVLDVLNNVLELSRLNSGEMQLVPRSFDVDTEFSRVTSMIKTGKEDVQMLFEGVGYPLMVVADSLRIRQVLLNLVSNAIKHTNSGFVKLKISSIGDGEVVDTNDKVRLLIEVIDTGSGLPDPIKDSPISKFAVGRETHGTGLGLMIAQKLVRILGGKHIKFESPWCPEMTGTRCFCEIQLQKKDSIIVRINPDTGGSSAIEVQVNPTKYAPIEAEEESPSLSSLASMWSSSSDRLRESMRGWKVLIADDVEINRGLMKRILTKTDLFKTLQWRCSLYCTGEVIQILRSHISKSRGLADDQEGSELVVPSAAPFDMYVLDQHMMNAGGKITGSECAEMIRALEVANNWKRSIIIMASGNNTEKDKKHFQKSGADSSWDKPYPSMNDMMMTILRLQRQSLCRWRG